MCLIIFDWQPDSVRPLTFASNRDEFYARPSAPADFWADHPNIYGGKDLKMGGTWLAVSADGRLAAVTNYRAPDLADYARSRGEIPKNFLSGGNSAHDYAQLLQDQQHLYAGFNALLFDGQDLIYFGNRSGSCPQKLKAGAYGLSNHLLDSPWPKVNKAKKMLKKIAEKETIGTSAEKLLKALADRHKAADDQLPDTGVGLELERFLSSIFIVSPSYGTRTSTVVIYENANIHITERNYSAPNPASETEASRKHANMARKQQGLSHRETYQRIVLSHSQ